MRINLTKKDLVNLVYMQIGFSKQISENIIDEFFSLIITNLQKEGKIKISKFGTFSIREKMVLFWQNHFAAEADVVGDARYFYWFHNKKTLQHHANLYHHP